MKKNASKKQASQKEYLGNDIKRYLGSLSEDFSHKVDVIAEQHVSVMRKLDEQSHLLHNNTAMIGKLLVDVTVIKGDIQEIKTDLKQKVDRAEFARLEKRVLAIESREYFGKSRK